MTCPSGCELEEVEQIRFFYVPGFEIAGRTMSVVCRTVPAINPYIPLNFPPGGTPRGISYPR